MTKRFAMAFDVEGPIINPSFDFAWLTLEELVKKSDKKELYDKVRIFDEYDDNRWLHERGIMGHSTGATPVISSLLSIASGARNEVQLDLARKHLEFTPGAIRLFRWLKDEKQVQPYLVSAAHPAAILPVAYKLEIASSHVFCNGYQLTEKKTQSFDGKRQAKGINADQILLEEIHERFPYDDYSGSETLLKFLDNYLDVCGEMNKFYTATKVDEHALGSLKGKQEQLLGEVEGKDKKLAEDLWYLLYSEVGLMGAHRKKLALMEIERRENVQKDSLIYTGDGMVDADPLAYAGHGVSVNCTSREALLSSKINIATPTIASIVHLIEFVTSGKTLTFESKDVLQREMNVESSTEETVPRTKVFTQKEIHKNIDVVTQANRQCKDYVKKAKPNNTP